MATNNFKSFSIGAGANVTSQADYEALAALLTGFQSGKASSAQINKALRQSSTMAYVLAQYISDIAAVDVLDNGMPATILANLKLAVQSVSKATAIPIMTGVVGQARNLSMKLTAAASTATISADEIIVETALGGSQYRIGNFSKTINLAITGAGGMDTGTATSSGFVAIYAIYNPTSGASALLAVNATSAVAPEVYGGSNMPTGFTASSLVSVWPTTSGSLLGIGMQTNRRVNVQRVAVLNASTYPTTITALSLATAIPRNAKKAFGYNVLTTTGSVGAAFRIGCDTNDPMTGETRASFFATSAGNSSTPFETTVGGVQTIYYAIALASGSLSAIGLYCSGYEF